ncbi:hypothetical protein TPY_1033 [Sulfobacillus acidophilus TPY]|nr:hypothetical protein TPY_1033 [Sulfobacillus acidophilus TPY]
MCPFSAITLPDWVEPNKALRDAIYARTRKPKKRHDAPEPLTAETDLTESLS